MQKIKKYKTLIIIVLSLYSAVILYLMFIGFDRITFTDNMYNFIPFKVIYSFCADFIESLSNHPELAKDELWTFTINILGNIGVFIPFGILLTLLYDGSLKKSFIVFIIGIIIVEILQLISHRGVCDVDDIMLNFVGFIVGYKIISLIRVEYVRTA